MNWSNMEERLGFSREEFMELLEVFLKAAEADIGLMQAGIDQKDHHKVARGAHSIKGAALNFELPVIREIAERIEKRANRGLLDGAREEIRLLRVSLLEISSAIQTGFTQCQAYSCSSGSCESVVRLRE
jgi:HPt (histidine-containing phosphotransfer) domain-containing protein